MKAYQLILLAFVLLFSYKGQSQDFGALKFDTYFSEYSKLEHALSQNTIQCLLQDSRGFIWIGTWDGLNRFDGYTFKIFRQDFHNPGNGLSNQTINDLEEDVFGNIWIATDKGLNKYNYLNRSFTSYFYSFVKDNSLPSDSISCLVSDSQGRLWIGTSRGLCFYNPSSDHFINYVHNPYRHSSIPSNLINDLQLDGNILWVATNKGLAAMNIATGKIKTYNSSFCPDMQCEHINEILPYNKDTLFVASRYGFAVFDKKHETWNYFENSEGAPIELPVTSLLNDKQGNIWIGTADDGVFLYNIRSKKFNSIYSSYENQYGLSNNSILSFLSTQNNNIWVGTWHGLNKFSPFSYKFDHFRIRGNDFDRDQNLVWSFVEMPDGNLLVGTNSGLVLFNVTDKTLVHFADRDFQDVKVRSMLRDSKNQIWVGTFDDGLYVMDINGRILKHIEVAENQLVGEQAWRIIEDKKGNIWIATFNGVSKYDVENNKFVNFISPGYESEKTISSNMDAAIIEDRFGIIWIGTYSGLNRYDPKSETFYVFRNIPGDENSLSDDRVFSLYEDSKGIIWVGTLGGGLNRYDRRTGGFMRFGVEDGLADNVIYDIVEDSKGYLWLTSNKGLMRFNMATFQVVNYDISDGVQSHEFNLGAAIKMSNGKIAVGGMNGFNVFQPEKIQQNSRIPRIVFTEFEILGKPYEFYLADGDTVEVSYDRNFFSIRFSALDFSNPSKNKYAYRLKNYDKDWIFTNSTNRKAEYTDVKPGKYYFQVKASNGDGVWNDKGVSLLIIVHPPFTQTWLFRVLIIILIISSTYLFIRSRIKKVRKQNEVEGKMLNIEKNMFELEQKALRLQMNPHFIFNSLNSVQSFIIQNDTDKAIGYLARFSKLMRLILATSRETFIPLEDELSLLEHYLELESLRFSERFEYSLFIEPSIDAEFTGIPPMIIQPHLENAILHGLMNKKDKGKLSVKIWDKGDYVLCIVEDNGIGRKRAMEIKEQGGLGQKSQGVMITKERLEILNRRNKDKISVEIVDLYNSDGQASGTRVRLTIPVIEL
ncbi:MAG: histidine kinase [Bacteroidales bacterium]|nr:histidine kinase [Bacteroidales bacterium]